MFGITNDVDDFSSIIKYSETGEQLWLVRDATFSTLFRVECTMDAYGNSFLGGTNYSSSTSYDFIVSKYSPNGIL